MQVHVLLFDAGSDSEGIHSLELAERRVVLLFENPDDAERYAGLLEAQDFPVPTVEALQRDEVEQFCRDAGYEARFIASDFKPTTPEERLFIVPPQTNRDVDNWKETPLSTESGAPADASFDDQHQNDSDSAETSNPELDALRKRLEGLL